MYGAGAIGAELAMLLSQSACEFDAFCDSRKYGQTFCGKPVMSPEELLRQAETCYVIVTVGEVYYTEVCAFLKETLRFPEEHILSDFAEDFLYNPAEQENRYFEFMEYFPEGGIFVDGGCLNGADSIRFAELCPRRGRILAFEPDQENYELSKARLEAAGIRDMSLIQTGLSNTSGESAFVEGAHGGGALMDIYKAPSLVVRPEGTSRIIRTAALDSFAGEGRFGMIKMDIEGAEYDALQGAKNIIVRDKPLLAICVYHRQGDMLAILDSLHSLVPEYRFWVRHYGPGACDTVVYAAL